MDQIPEKVQFLVEECHEVKEEEDALTTILQKEPPIVTDYVVERPKPKAEIIDLTHKDVFALDVPGYYVIKLVFDHSLKIKPRRILAYNEVSMAQILAYTRMILGRLNHPKLKLSRNSSLFILIKDYLITPSTLLLELYDKYHKKEKKRLKIVVVIEENTFG